MELTETDKTFEKASPGYYVFDAKEIEAKCVKCGRKFKTHLSCLRFCSRDHQLAFMRELTTGSHVLKQFSGHIRSAVNTSVNKSGLGAVHTTVHKKPIGKDRKEYRREWMAKLRADKKAQKNLPVPASAEPQITQGKAPDTGSGEAREDANRTPVTGKGINNRPDSRGGQNSL